ncbi:MAG: glycine cleavage system protein R [Verrucomicrobiales bacterium]
MTVLAPDRTGIVQTLSLTVAENGGNWLESRMARLAGQFAGIVRVEIEESQAEALIKALSTLEGISIQATVEGPDCEQERNHLTLDVVGNDRPGIVKTLSSAIAGAGANLEDLHTSLESAPMAGHPLFHAKGIVSLPEALAPGALIAAIEAVGEDLNVTVGEPN